MILEILIAVLFVIMLGIGLISIFRFAGYEKISFKEAVDLTGNPIVTFYSGQKKLNFLLDTGANVSMINLDDLTGCKYEDTGEQMNNMGIEGQKKVLNISHIYLQYKDNLFEEDVLTSDLSAAFTGVKNVTGVTIHGILGTSFFTKYKYVLDFEEFVAYSKK